MHFKSNWMSNRPPRKCRLLNVADSILPTMSVKTFEKLEMIAKGWPRGSEAWERRRH